MSQFLTSTDIEGGSSPHIKKILKGKNVRIASAFLGKGAEDEVKSGSRLLCDIGMGGTNPAALKKLSKKLGRDNLRYTPNFHAKVYLSDQGCLVGSANLSSNGVGFLSHARLTEASILTGPDDITAKTAGEWFEKLWANAEVIGPDEIKRAEMTWNSSKRGTPQGHGGYNNFLDSLNNEKSGLASKWNFLISREQHSKSESAAINIGKKKIVQSEGWELKEKIDAFNNLSKRKKLDGHYISLHRGRRGKLYLQALQFIGNLNLRDEDGDKMKISYFSILPWPKDIPPLSNDDLKISGKLSEKINTSKDEKIFGKSLDAKTFSNFIEKLNP